MEKEQNKELSSGGIKKVLEFLPEFQDAKFKPGKWYPSEHVGNATLTFPYYEYSNSVKNFIQTLVCINCIVHLIN